MTVRNVTLLPEPDSPTTPSVLPSSSEKFTPDDGLDDAVVGPEAGREVLDLEHRHQWGLTLGSRKP